MGALEAKKQFMLSGLSLEGYENFNPACCQYAPKLETDLSQRQAPGIQSETGDTEEYRYKASAATWLPRVSQNREKYLFKHAHDWQNQALSEEVKDHLAGCEEMAGKACEAKWFSLADFKSAWLV